MRHTIYILLAAVLAAACSGPVTIRHTRTMAWGRCTYQGETRAGKPHGYGVLTIGDSVVYSGEWLDGQRHGRGTVADPEGRRIDGLWHADTLVRGTRTDRHGTYQGEMNRRMQPHGHGILQAADMTYYDGSWVDGRRQGFGCGINGRYKVQAGEWRNDRYRGERMLYSIERIYGIDISRYQHEKDNKVYPIGQDKLCITNLGKISNKRISGRVNYPVEFVYIKSTEGTTVVNKYYADDYRQARRHGIKCGAYHFFSLASDARRQALFFLDNSRFTAGDFPPVLDVEPSDEQIARAGGPEVMFRAIRVWMKTVERHTRTRPILYVSQSFVNKYLPLAPDVRDAYQVWIARYGEFKPDVKLAFWQLSPDGRVAGIHGDVDINVFNGFGDQYAIFVEKNMVKGKK